MMKTSAKDRRTAIRAKRILSIQYRLHKSQLKKADRSWHLSTTHDMSAVGLSFLSEVPFLVDDILEMHVIMSGVLDIFKGYGEVVRIERKETGVFYFIAVRFIDLKSPSRKKPATKGLKVSRIKKA